MNKFKWCHEVKARKLQNEGELAFKCDLNSDQPWCTLDPRYQHGEILIPGMTMTADSVLGVWEGLKLIGDKAPRIGLGYFKGIGRERPVQEDEILYGWSMEGRTIGQVEARHRIYVPAYTYMLKHKAAKALREAYTILKDKKKDVYFYDSYGNDDIEEASPLSPSAILVAYLNGVMEDAEVL